jgi:signal transduction histidine kinase
MPRTPKLAMLLAQTLWYTCFTMSDVFSPQPEAFPTETERRGALVLRTLPVLLIPVLLSVVTAIILRLTFPEPPFADRVDEVRVGALVPVVALVIFFISLIVLVRLGRPTLSALFLIFVWTLVTTLASLYNGVTSYTPALLIIPICVAGLLIDGAASVSLAGLATLLVVSITWMQMRGVNFQDDTLPSFMVEAAPILALGFWIGLFWTVAALTSLLAGSLQRTLKQSQMQAEALSRLSSELEARVAAQTEALLAQSREAAVLEERTRLAREIHDTLAQGLTGVVVQLGAAQRALASAPEEGQEHLELAHRMARESLAEARRSVWNLRAPALERGDLSDALRGLAERPLHAETRTTFEQRGDPWPLPPDVESSLLRVGQEALVNVAKHARATEAIILLEYTSTDVRLTVRDNGVGFDEGTLHQHTTTLGPWSGFGLLGMRERVAALGGTLELSNADGAEVRVVVPRMERNVEPSTLLSLPQTEKIAT